MISCGVFYESFRATRCSIDGFRFFFGLASSFIRTARFTTGILGVHVQTAAVGPIRTGEMADTADLQLIANFGRLDDQWTGMSPARIRALLRGDGFVVSEK